MGGMCQDGSLEKLKVLIRNLVGGTDGKQGLAVEKNYRSLRVLCFV